jgi:hypothetical protein
MFGKDRVKHRVPDDLYQHTSFLNVPTVAEASKVLESTKARGPFWDVVWS